MELPRIQASLRFGQVLHANSHNPDLQYVQRNVYVAYGNMQNF